MNDRKNLTPVRHAIVGVGAGIMHRHREALKLEEFELVGGSDISTERGKPNADAFGVPFYTDHRVMLRELKPEVVVVTAPHPYHASIAIDAMEAGSHVLVEKPVAVRVSEADAMVETSKRTGKLCAINFQQRCRSDMRTLAKLLAENRLGQVQALEMMTAWPRTKAYYDSGDWRGTWAGEGGGVLMNQAPHQLDLVCHLLGLPESVFAYTTRTLHDIETEDTVHAVCRWANGMTGFIHITTAEAGRPERLEISGTAGSVQILEGKLSVRTFAPDFRETIAHSAERIPKIATEELAVTPEPGQGSHNEIYLNLYDALRNGAPLVATVESGRMALELANAMILSGHTGKEVSLPVDRAAYDKLFAELVKSSHYPPPV